MGEAINLVNNFKVEKVIFNCGEFNDLEQELIKVLDKKKIKYYSCIKELNIDKNKLIKQYESNVVDFVKNPILIGNSDRYNIFSEKVLQKLILEDIENFLDELGNGFTFIKSEYPIKIGDDIII